MTVYVSQQPVTNNRGWVPNLAPAMEYGKLKFVFPGGTHPYQTPNKSLSEAVDVLRKFDPEQDYLLWPNTGDPASMWACIMALVLLGVRSASYLYWQPEYRDKPGHYIPVEYSLKEHYHGTE